MSREKELYGILFEHMALHDLDDLPDGAWQQYLMDAVVDFNQTFATDYDPHEAWLMYVEHKSTNQQVELVDEAH